MNQLHKKGQGSSALTEHRKDKMSHTGTAHTEAAPFGNYQIVVYPYQNMKGYEMVHSSVVTPAIYACEEAAEQDLLTAKRMLDYGCNCAQIAEELHRRLSGER